MKILALILALTPLSTLGQTKNKEAQSYSVSFGFTNSRFALDSNGFVGKKHLDTLYYSKNEISAIGYYAIDRNDKKSSYKVGTWIEYYPNGQIKSKGAYDIYSLLSCSSALPRRTDFNYKVGEWVYYYENGQIKATGVYETTKYIAHTGISNQYAVKSNITSSWSFFNIDGSICKNTEKLMVEIE